MGLELGVASEKYRGYVSTRPGYCRIDGDEKEGDWQEISG